MTRGDYRQRCPRGDTAAQKCKALEANERRSHSSERRDQCPTIPESYFVATLERIRPPKPRRNKDTLLETNGPIAHDTGLRSASRRNQNPHSCPQPLHSSWHTCHRACRLNPSGVRVERPSPYLCNKAPQLFRRPHKYEESFNYRNHRARWLLSCRISSRQRLRSTRNQTACFFPQHAEGRSYL